MQIIVWEDKHSTKYYDASTLEAWDTSAIEILKHLTDERYGYLRRVDVADIYISDENKRLVQINLNDLPEIARVELEAKVSGAKKRVEQTIKKYETENEQYDLARSYIEAGKSPIYTSPDGWYSCPMSWRILQSRNGAEYENFTLEDVFTREDSDD